MKGKHTLFYLPLLNLILVSCIKEIVYSDLPQLVNVTRFTVTIEWKTQKPVSASIQWRDSQGKNWKLREEKKIVFHRFTLTGLLPDKKYTYSISTIPHSDFFFRTAPNSGTPFRFCILNAEEYSLDTIKSFYPDFIILIRADATNRIKMTPEFQELNTHIPFFSDSFQFDWGSFFIQSYGYKNNTNHNNGIIIIDSIREMDYESEKSDSVFYTIFVTSTESTAIDIDTAHFISCVSTGSKTVCVEIQGEEIKAGFGSGNLNVLVKKGSPSFEKTCLLCRRLLEQKHYTQSIAFYRQFIKENSEQKLHDDVMYQIAIIYDRYLFEYTHAMNAYKELLDSFSHSQLSHKAEMRLSYLTNHGDYSYKPLTIFEKNKLAYNFEKEEKSLQTIEKLLKEFKDCSLREEIILWLGNTYSHLNGEKAIQYLERLTMDSISDTVYWQAAFKIGTILYDQKKFKQSEQYHRKLLQKFPDKKGVLHIKIDRSIRNQKREILFISAIFSIVLSFLFVFLMNPKGFSFVFGKSMYYSIGMYTFSGFVSIILYYEYLKPLLPFILAVSFFMPVILFIAKQLVYKLSYRKFPRLPKLVISSSLTVVLTLAILYICFKHFHYLYVLERVFQ